jgi:superfamily II DNA or RNA helicase
LATGAGKTILVLFFALAAYTADKNKNTILVFPSIDLVHQTLTDLFGKFEPLLDYFNIEKKEIYGVCSKRGGFESHEVQTAPLLNANEPIQTNGHLFLFCNASLRREPRKSRICDD